jgi:hypothetical protein
MDSNLKVSTGVIFKIKRAPSMAFQTLVKNLKRNEPKMPRFMNDAKGRMEDNPNDPDYAKAMAEYQTQSDLALLDAAILLCTDIVTIPEGTDKPEDTEWSDNLWLAGINVDQLGIAEGSKKRQRYLAWVKFYAAATDEDIVAINREISRVNGVSEGDVTAAMAAYKSDARGGTD